VSGIRMSEVSRESVASAALWLHLNEEYVTEAGLRGAASADILYDFNVCIRALGDGPSPWRYHDAPKDVNLLVELESGVHEIAAHVEQPSMQPGTGLGEYKWFTKCGRQLMTVKRWMRIPE